MSVGSFMNNGRPFEANPEGLRPLLDNAAISPAPISRFAPKTLSLTSRVSVPFKKANSLVNLASLNQILNNG